MDKVVINKVLVLDPNPSGFSCQDKFKAEYSCYEQLEHEIAFKVVYVCCSLDDECNPDLDTIFIQPVTDGCLAFEIQCERPEIELIPENDLI